jgi:cytochrome P450
MGGNEMNAPVHYDLQQEVAAIPLDRIDVSDPKLFETDTVGAYFSRLRREEPVHYCADSQFGPYWSVTKYKDIMQVEVAHQVFSSETHLGGITIRDRPVEFQRPSFISMDPPKHDVQRKVVSPIVAPANLANLADTIRSRAATILDGLPRGEVFDWVDRVSIELTTQMLATLFDFPFADRRKLTYWSDVATVDVNAGTEIDSEEKRDVVLRECLEYFVGLWNERVNAPPRNDLVSMLAQLDLRRAARAEPQSRSVPQTAGQPGADTRHGARDHPLPVTDRAHAAHRPCRCRIGRQADPQGRQGGDVVQIGQSR